MASRRAFLVGLAVSTVASEAALAPAFATTVEQPPAPRSLIFDNRFAQARTAAQRAKSRGIPTFGFAGEVSGLWYGRLLPVFRQDSAPFAGLTSVGTLFCLERMAWDLGMHVVLRIDHVERPGQGWSHIPAGAMPVGLAAALTSGVNPESADFGARAADLVLDRGAYWRDCTHAAAPEVDGPPGEALVTWIIAPRHLAARAAAPSVRKG